MKLELLGTLFLSDKRKDLLLLLMEEPKNIEDIKKILNVTSSAIMTQIKILISQGLIIHEDDLYKLSDIGKVVVKKMKPAAEHSGGIFGAYGLLGKPQHKCNPCQPS